MIGANVRLGPNCVVGASAVVDGWTDIGDGTEIFSFASIGLIPQDLKFKGEETRLVIGRRNIFREFVTIHRGTRGGGGVTTIGDRNVFMAYVHVAHDCHVGNDTIFGNMATLGGHVTVEDFANVSAGSGVHQFCRVGPLRVHRRLLGRDQGRAAVRADGRQPAGADFRRQHHRPDAPRRAAGRDREAEGVVPLPPAVEAEYDQGDAADPARPRRSPARKWNTSSTSSARSQRGVILRRGTRRAEVLADE